MESYLGYASLPLHYCLHWKVSRLLENVIDRRIDNSISTSGITKTAKEEMRIHLGLEIHKY